MAEPVTVIVERALAMLIAEQPMIHDDSTSAAPRIAAAGEIGYREDQRASFNCSSSEKAGMTAPSARTSRADPPGYAPRAAPFRQVAVKSTRRA